MVMAKVYIILLLTDGCIAQEVKWYQRAEEIQYAYETTDVLKVVFKEQKETFIQNIPCMLYVKLFANDL